MAAAGVHAEDRRDRPSSSYGAFLGTLAAVADAERKGLALCLERETADMLYLLTDSQAALHTALNLSQGVPPRSGLEVALKKALWNRRDQDTAITWIRSHIGIPGNVKADRRAAYESLLGRVASSQGVRTVSRAIRRSDRAQQGPGYFT